MTTTVKRSRYGTVNYGSQKEQLKSAQRYGRHVERSLHVDMRRAEIADRARRYKRRVLKMREEWYSEKEREQRGKYYTLEAFIERWTPYGFSADEIRRVIFYRSWQWLLPQQNGEGD